MSSEHLAVAVGEQMPVDLPEHSDGTPYGLPMMLCKWPLGMVLPADISPAHEEALMQAAPAGPITRLICLQGHQRLLTMHEHTDAQAYLPMIQCSIYLRGPSGPMHRPLHWLAAADVLGLGEPYKSQMDQVLHRLLDQRGKGPPVRLMVTGRDRRLLMVANMAMHNRAAVVWAGALMLAISGGTLSPAEFAEQVAVAQADLMPTVVQHGCMRQLMPVAIGGQQEALRGGQLMVWLLRHGWLHPRQMACEDLAGDLA